MEQLRALVDSVDRFVIRFMDVVGIPFLRVGVGVVFIWFGALKPLGLSPAEELLAATVYWWTPEVVVPAIWLLGGADWCRVFDSLDDEGGDFTARPANGRNVPSTGSPPRGGVDVVSVGAHPGGAIHHQEPGGYRRGLGNWLPRRGPAGRQTGLETAEPDGVPVRCHRSDPTLRPNEKRGLGWPCGCG